MGRWIKGHLILCLVCLNGAQQLQALGSWGCEAGPSDETCGQPSIIVQFARSEESPSILRSMGQWIWATIRGAMAELIIESASGTLALLRDNPSLVEVGIDEVLSTSVRRIVLPMAGLSSAVIGGLIFRDTLKKEGRRRHVLHYLLRYLIGMGMMAAGLTAILCSGPS